jgi:hypothetical protein
MSIEQMKPALISLFIFLLACNKDADITGKARRAKGIVINAGVDAPDGCGWMIKMEDDGKLYHPDQLPGVAHENNLDVWIDYFNTTDSFYCGIGTTAYPSINVIGIVQR